MRFGLIVSMFLASVLLAVSWTDTCGADDGSIHRYYDTFGSGTYNPLPTTPRRSYDSNKKRKSTGANDEKDLRKKYKNYNMRKGVRYFSKKQYYKAIEQFTKVLGRNSSHIEAYNFRGSAYFATMQYTSAIRDFTKAIRLAPDSASLYINRGKSYFGKNQLKEAQKDFNKAIKLNPKETSVYEVMGEYYAEKKHYGKAIDIYTKAIKADPKVDYFFIKRAELFFTTGKFKMARLDFKNAITLGKNISQLDRLYILHLISTVKSKASRTIYRETLYQFNEHVKSKKNSDWIRTVARYFLDMDGTSEEDVLQVARNSRNKDEVIPRLCGTYYYLGEKSLMKGDRKGAEEFFNKALATKYKVMPEYDYAKATIKLSGLSMASAKPKATATRSTSSLPPVLSIKDIVFSEKVLDAGETADLSITVRNTGPGDAEGVYVDLVSDLSGVEFPGNKTFPTIAKNGGERKITVSVKGGMDLPTAKANLDIKIIEPNFKMNLRAKRLAFATRKFRNPKLVLAKFAVLESNSSNPNNRIDINEIIDVKFAVQNVGVGTAENVDIRVRNNQKGVMLIGVVDNGRIVRKNPRIARLEAGKYTTIVYRYVTNSEFSGKALSFSLNANEKTRRYGLSEVKTVAINSELKEEGYIRQVRLDDDAVTGGVVIEDVPDFVVDVEKNLPGTRMKNKDSIAVVIGNRDYKKAKRVEFAINDAEAVRAYLAEVFGYREGNIFFLPNVSKGDFELYFGNLGNHRGKLFNHVKPGRSDVFVYYSGHGAPGLKDKKGYFVPVEADPQYIELGGYQADVFFENLSRIPARSLTVVLDACFSGADIHENISPMVLEISNPAASLKKGVVLSSSRGSQVSSWYNDKRHGMFTYFFLKAIHNRNADYDRNGRLTFEETYKYISDNSDGVPYFARRIHGVEQVPTIEGEYRDKVLVRYK
jgi:lipoprotein NlpI